MVKIRVQGHSRHEVYMALARIKQCLRVVRQSKIYEPKLLRGERPNPFFTLYLDIE